MEKFGVLCNVKEYPYPPPLEPVQINTKLINHMVNKTLHQVPKEVLSFRT